MKWFFQFPTVVLTAISVVAAFIAPAYSDQTTDQLRTKLQPRFGIENPIKNISPSPIVGLYEVDLGAHIVYSDANGDYLVSGEITEAGTHKNLTEQRLSEINRIDFAKLPFVNAVKVVKGNGSRKMAVFTDPNCPYCKKLDATLKLTDNVTVYTFLYPVLSTDSVVKSKSIWCSADRAKAWNAWMQDHLEPSAAGTCDTAAIDRNLALGRTIHVEGTPTVFFADGRRLLGAIQPTDLEKELSTAH